MFAKRQLKKQVVSLRKKGLTYSKILARVPVAKSTLSLWLRDVGLSKRQKQKITQARLDAGKRGGLARRVQRIEKTKRIFTQAISEIGDISERELWLIGIALYWAEGTKEKKYRPSVEVMFANSDPRMIILFLKWLEIIKVSRGDIFFELYIHESNRNKAQNMLKSWAIHTQYPPSVFRVYFKRNSMKRGRIFSQDHIGLLRIRVRRSTDLNRKISGWTQGICRQCRVV